MKIFDHTIYTSTKIDRHDKTSALSVPSVVDTYQYSCRGNIYSGSETAWTLDKQTTFTYDGWNLIQEQTTSGSDISLTNSAFTQFRTSNYTYIADKGNDEGVKTSNGNGLEEALYKGFAFELIDTAGVVKAHYEYSPFGKVVHKSGPLADKNPFQFSTKYLDNETQLYYYGLRYYNPENGRWINRDPIEELGGFNIFSFVTSNPLNLIDYLGMSPVKNTQSKKPKTTKKEKIRDKYKNNIGFHIWIGAVDTSLDNVCACFLIFKPSYDIDADSFSVVEPFSTVTIKNLFHEQKDCCSDYTVLINLRLKPKNRKIVDDVAPKGRTRWDGGNFGVPNGYEYCTDGTTTSFWTFKRGTAPISLTCVDLMIHDDKPSFGIDYMLQTYTVQVPLCDIINKKKKCLEFVIYDGGSGILVGRIKVCFE